MSERITGSTSEFFLPSRTSTTNQKYTYVQQTAYISPYFITTVLPI